jgi:tetratricopeptide (TPR) repeat protein
LEAERLEPGNSTIELNLATIRLASTNTTVADAARATLQRFATNATFHATALHELLADAAARQSLADATDFLRRIVQDPSASLGDKIEYLEVLHRIKSAEFSQYLASLERASMNSPQCAFAVGRWKAGIDETNALHWLQSLPPQVQTNQPVPLVITDCQIALKDWNGILALVQEQDWGEANYYKLALESLAERSLNKKTAADASWRKSLRACVHRSDRLAHLAQITGAWGWTAERTEVLRETIEESPSASWAVNQLANQYYAAGNTEEMEALYSKVYSRDPSDPRVKNNLAALYMLRKTDLDKAYQMAKDAYSSSTNNPFFVSTYAYALLMQNKKDEALEIVDRLNSDCLKIPSVALYYGAVQAAAGNKDKAAPAIKRAESAKLLPEERQIVQMAKASL